MDCCTKISNNNMVWNVLRTAIFVHIPAKKPFRIQKQLRSCLFDDQLLPQASTLTSRSFTCAPDCSDTYSVSLLSWMVSLHSMIILGNVMLLFNTSAVELDNTRLASCTSEGVVIADETSSAERGALWYFASSSVYWYSIIIRILV